MGDEEHADAGEQVSDARRRHARAEHERGDGISRDSRQAVARRTSASRSSTTISARISATPISRACLTKLPVVKGHAAAARRARRCRWQRGRRHQIAAADGAARHLHGWNVTTSGIFKGQLCGSSFGSSPIGGFIPVREDESRAHGERRSAAVARRALQGSRRLRARGENGGRHAGGRWVSAAQRTRLR